MDIHLQYFAQIRQAAGCTQESLGVPPGTRLATALTLAAQRHDPAFGRILFDDQDQVRPGIILLCNDQAVGPDRILMEGDRLAVFSPVAGG